MNLANRITIARIILTPFFIASVVYSRMDLALIFFILAILSDGIDGFIARTLKQKTALGTMLDPIADKILLISAYICFSMASVIPSHLKLPPYVPIIIISRDFIIVVGAAIVHLTTGDLKVSPSILGKITTFFQMITIVGILLQFDYSYVIWNITALLTVFSGIDYVIKGSKALSENNAHVKKAA